MFIDDEGPAEPVTTRSLLEHLKAVRDSFGSEIMLTPLVAIHKNTLAAMIGLLEAQSTNASAG